MKKIVALVLSLALVLALGTVAFADTTTTTFKGNVLDEKNVADYLEAVNVTKTVTSKVVTTSGSDTTTIYTADKYAVDGKIYSAVSADAAWTNKIVDKDGKLLATVVLAEDLHTSAVITKSGEGTGKTGDYDKGVKYVVIGGKAYNATETDLTKWAVNSKGEFVNYGTELVPIPVNTSYAQANKEGYVIYNTSGKVIAFKDNDGKQYDVVEKVPANYTGKVETITIGGNIYTYLLGAAAAQTPAEGVTSAKTFDAGVAMYAGLALMSVAGSAVVIGKKKEF